MNLDEACQAADGAVFAKTGGHLSDVQLFILKGALRGQTYEQIADDSNYSVSYIKKVVGPGLWEMLSKALGEPVSKTNFQSALARSLTFNPPRAATTVVPLVEAAAARLSNVPNVSVFFGRRDELDRLETWIVADHCRLVMLSGMGGIGKTCLAAKLARQMQHSFDTVVWKSLAQPPALVDFIRELVQRLGGAAELPETVDEQISYLIELARSRRCLVVLDSIEGILQSGELAGVYQPIGEAYGALLLRFGEEDHQSCFLLVGREQPADLVSLAGEQLPVRSLKLRGLTPEDARQLLAAKGVRVDQSGIEELIQLKRGNPLALRIVTSTIQELFNGNVAQLLKQSTILIGDTLLDLLHEQFERLSELEKGVIYWLALDHQSLSHLRNNARFLVPSSSELMRSLQSLKRRSLLEEEMDPEAAEAVFSLQPVVLRYTLTRLGEQASQDVLHTIQTPAIQQLGLLRTHALFRDALLPGILPTRMVGQVVVDRLNRTLGDRQAIEQVLTDRLVALQDKPTQVTGYATDNLYNLLRIVESQVP